MTTTQFKRMAVLVSLLPSIALAQNPFAKNRDQVKIAQSSDGKSVAIASGPGAVVSVTQPRRSAIGSIPAKIFKSEAAGNRAFSFAGDLQNAPINVGDVRIANGDIEIEGLGILKGVLNGTPLAAKSQRKSARLLMLAKQYEACLKLMQTNNTNDRLQVKSLACFALGQFETAAIDAYRVVANGQTWNWKQLRSYYELKKDYEQQFRALQYAANNSDDQPHLHFLVGYHLMMMGHQEHARKAFAEVVRLRPNEALSTKLIKELSDTDAPPSVD